MRMNVENPQPKGDLTHYVVVFQYGKVASTALVATLNQVPGVEAVQSHFLGEHAFSQMLPMLVSPNTSDYFFYHQMGQFHQNVQTTRRMAQIQAGKRGEKLVLLSVVRDPWDWFRSAFTQDIQGYLPNLLRLAAQAGLEGKNELETVQNVVSALLELMSRIVDLEGGLDRVIGKILGKGFNLNAHSNLSPMSGYEQFFYLMLRPFIWLDQHFEIVSGTNVRNMDKMDGFWRCETTFSNLIVLKYSDLERAFPEAMASCGITIANPILVRNTSSEKEFNQEIRQAFQASQSLRLREQFSDTDHARFFNFP